MTSIDQALLGAAPAKQGGQNGKITDKPADEQGSKGRDAFESVFADAGRKKDDRSNTDTEKTAGGDAQQAKGSFASFRLAGRFEQQGSAGMTIPKEVFQEEGAGSILEQDTGAAPEDGEITRTGKDGTATGRRFDLKAALDAIRQGEAGNEDDAGGPKEQVDVSGPDMTQLMQLLAAAQEQKSDGQTVPDGTRIAAASFQDMPRQAKADAKKDTGIAVARFNDGNDNAPLLMTDTAETETDTLFRFAREDGKGRQLDLKVSAAGQRNADREDAPAPKIENVTVVESRRYLGLPANSNASALTTAMSTNSSWSAAMQQGSPVLPSAEHAATGKVVNTLKLQMHPIDLGAVTATLRLTGDQLNVDLRVETGEAYRQLTDDQKGILKALKAQGFAVEQINVVLVQPSDPSAANQNAGNSNQQQFGQMPRDGGGPQQGLGQQNDGRQASANEGRLQKDEAGDEPVGGLGAERGRPDHVYL